MGFPYKFYSIHLNAFGEFAIHFAVGTFILDVLIIFVIYTIVLALICRIKNILAGMSEKPQSRVKRNI